MASLYLVWQVEGIAINSHWCSNFYFLPKTNGSFPYVTSCSLMYLLCVGLRADEKQSKINNASAYIFHVISQELLNVSVVVSVKTAQRLKNQTEEE